MQKFGWVLIVGVLSACSQDANFQATAERNVAQQLKDPDSAKFRSAYLVRRQADENGNSDLALCGVVDGKNSFGAYSGGTRFVAFGYQGESRTQVSDVRFDDSSKQQPTVDSRGTDKPETVFEKVYWNEHCVDAMHPPTYTATSE